MQYPSQEILRELLHYDPDTGVFTWRQRERSWFDTYKGWAMWNARYPGRTAGNIKVKESGYSYVNIGVMKKLYSAHRLAWVYMTGSQPPKEIDHINRDATDNRWENLRDGTGYVNARNHSLQSNNTSGFCGVSMHPVNKNWLAYANLDGERVRLGSHSTKEAARKAAEDFRRKHGYDSTHGKTPTPYSQPPNQNELT